MGLTPGCLGSSALAEAGTLTRLAPGVALAAAAALPTVAITAEAAFALAGFRRGQRQARDHCKQTRATAWPLVGIWTDA